MVNQWRVDNVNTKKNFFLVCTLEIRAILNLFNLTRFNIIDNECSINVEMYIWISNFYSVVQIVIVSVNGFQIFKSNQKCKVDQRQLYF